MAIRRSVLIVLLVAVGACGNGWRSKEIQLVDVQGRTVIAGPHCEPEARLEVKETSTEVRLTFEVNGDHMGDCYGTASATLAAELGDRRLVDTATGKAPKLGPHP